MPKGCIVSSPCFPNYISCMRFGQSFNSKHPEVIGSWIQFARHAQSTKTSSDGVPLWLSLCLLGLMHLGVCKGILHRSSVYGVTEKMWLENWEWRIGKEKQGRKKYIRSPIVIIMTYIVKIVETLVYLKKKCILIYIFFFIYIYIYSHIYIYLDI